MAIATTTYDDNVLAPAFPNIQLEIDNDEAHFLSTSRSFRGVFLVPTTDLTTLRFSKTGNNSSYPLGNEKYVSVNDNDTIIGIKTKIIFCGS